jgi:hypothetical protein
LCSAILRAGLIDWKSYSDRRQKFERKICEVSCSINKIVSFREGAKNKFNRLDLLLAKCDPL